MPRTRSQTAAIAELGHTPPSPSHSASRSPARTITRRNGRNVFQRICNELNMMNINEINKQGLKDLGIKFSGFGNADQFLNKLRSNDCVLPHGKETRVRQAWGSPIGGSRKRKTMRKTRGRK